MIDNECQISSQTQGMRYALNSLKKENIFGLELYEIRNLLMFVWVNRVRVCVDEDSHKISTSLNWVAENIIKVD